MPFTIFCHLKSPQDAFEFLRANGAAVEGQGDEWSARYVLRKGMFRKKLRITISYDREWCSPPNWPQQIAGMQNYIANWEMSDALREKLMPLIRQFAFNLGIVNEPEIAKGDDPRLEIMHALADHMGAAFFTPGAMLDSLFRPFAAADGETDPDAVMPVVPEIQIDVPDELLERVQQGNTDLPDDLEEDEGEPEPPTAERVAKRLYVMVAVAARGLLDMSLAMGHEPAYSLEELHAWLGQLDVADEIEPAERTILETAPGQLAQQDALNSVWTLEALVVLAWALRLAELPKYDELVSTDQLLEGLSFLDPEICQRNLSRASLRSDEELLAHNNQIFSLNWRMVDFRLRPQAVDYANAVIAGRLFGLSWAVLKDGDLALQGVPISEADAELVGTVNSLAVERHKASNWLLGYARLYSRVSADT